MPQEKGEKLLCVDDLRHAEYLKWRLISMELLTTDGTLCAVKAACTVWSEGKPGDNIKRLPIAI